eukprot:1158451-Pelagomonas_calceolata.AAC.7
MQHFKSTITSGNHLGLATLLEQQANGGKDQQVRIGWLDHRPCCWDAMPTRSTSEDKCAA